MLNVVLVRSFTKAHHILEVFHRDFPSVFLFLEHLKCQSGENPPQWMRLTVLEPRLFSVHHRESTMVSTSMECRSRETPTIDYFFEF